MIKKQTFIILTLLCIMSLFATAASANGIEDATIGIGDGSGYVTIPIIITNSTNVGSVDITLRYDPSIVIVVDVVKGDMDTTALNLENTADGWIRIGAFQVGDGLSDTFVLANVSFEPVGTTGSCPLEISVTTFGDATSNSTEMPYVVDNGTYTISYVTPDSRSNREGTYPPVPDNDSGNNVTEDTPENKTVIETPTAPPPKTLPGEKPDDPKEVSTTWVLIAVVLVLMAASSWYIIRKRRQ